MNRGKVLIVEDEEYQREIFKTILSSDGYDVRVCGDGKMAISICEEFNPDAIICDLKLTDMDGIELLEKINEIAEIKPAFIIVTGHGSIESAVDAIKKGAFDYITKPVDRTKILILTKRACEHTHLLKENYLLKQEIEKEFSINGIIGESPKFQEVIKMIKMVAPLDVTVLLLGETGTGKSLIAKAIHFLSNRKYKIFQVLNCSAIPETLIESELFGYEKGAFTGAFMGKEGIIELCNGGTLFLDEIGELSMSVQAKLLNFIEEKRARRIGGKQDYSVDVRIIAATNRDLKEEIKKGKFREDLFFRISAFPISIPALRDRGSDIVFLINYFINKYNTKFKKNIQGVSNDAMNLLISYSWPGNIRELESVIERAVLLSKNEIINSSDINIWNKVPNKVYDFEIPSEGISLDEFEKQLIFQAMKKCNGVISRAAKLLGITYKTLEYRLKKYKISY